MRNTDAGSPPAGEDSPGCPSPLKRLAQAYDRADNAVTPAQVRSCLGDQLVTLAHAEYYKQGNDAKTALKALKDAEQNWKNREEDVNYVGLALEQAHDDLAVANKKRNAAQNEVERRRTDYEKLCESLAKCAHAVGIYSEDKRRRTNPGPIGALATPVAPVTPSLTGGGDDSSRRTAGADAVIDGGVVDDDAPRR